MAVSRWAELRGEVDRVAVDTSGEMNRGGGRWREFGGDGQSSREMDRVGVVRSEQTDRGKRLTGVGEMDRVGGRWTGMGSLRWPCSSGPLSGHHSAAWCWVVLGETRPLWL